MASQSSKSDSFRRQVLDFVRDDPELMRRVVGSSAGAASGGTPSLVATEIGDGNLNYVFRVSAAGSASGGESIIVKKTPPYIRLVGESWPLPASRLLYERAYMDAANSAAPGSCPEVFACDEKRFILAMQDMGSMKVLRAEIANGEPQPGVGPAVGRALAEIHFSTSVFNGTKSGRNKQIPFFSGNNALVETTVKVFFSDPFYAAPMNGWKKRSPGIESAVKRLQANAALKPLAYKYRNRFVDCRQALLHGDLHTGSIFVKGVQVGAKRGDTEQDEKQSAANPVAFFDCEFACMGPYGFDIGQLVGNMILGAASQRAYGDAATRGGLRGKVEKALLADVEELWQNYASAFVTAWQSRGEKLFPGLDDPKHVISGTCDDIWSDTQAYAAFAIIRRIVGIADAPEFRACKDLKQRANVETALLGFAEQVLCDPAPTVAAFLERLRTALKDV